MSDGVESAREPGHVRVIRCGVDWKACVPSEMKIPIAVFVINCGIVYKHTHTRTHDDGIYALRIRDACARVSSPIARSTQRTPH